MNRKIDNPFVYFKHKAFRIGNLFLPIVIFATLSIAGNLYADNKNASNYVEGLKQNHSTISNGNLNNFKSKNNFQFDSASQNGAFVPTRVNSGLEALFTFREGEGTTVNDVSGVGSPLNLTISDIGAVRWLPNGGLSVLSPTAIQSEQAASKLISAAKTSNEMTFEAWVVPANITQDGPARVMSISANTGYRNMTLGQVDDSINGRIRTTDTSKNGMPAINSPGGGLIASLHHLVFTRSSGGERTLYIDGKQVLKDSSVQGVLSNWDNTYHLILANEITSDRPWLGDYYLVAVYGRALSASEVEQNFQAGVSDLPSNTAPNAVEDEVSMLTGQTVKVSVLANDFDLDGDQLIITDIQSTHALVSATVNPDNTVDITVDASLALEEVSLTYTISDGNGGFASAQVVVTLINNSGRVTKDLQALYAFNEGSGSMVSDSSGVSPVLDLTILDPAGVVWQEGGGLTVVSSNQLYSTTPASKVIETAKQTNEITLEAWVSPANITQSGPARIISISADSGNRNITLGQVRSHLQGRVRSTETNKNGRPEFNSPEGGLTTGLHHLVLTRSKNGVRNIYIDGTQVVSDASIGGNFSNWNQTYQLTLANEFVNERAWLGTYHLAAIYSRALTATEVTQNFIAGYSDASDNSNPVAESDQVITPQDTAIVIDVLANDSDADGDNLSINSISEAASGKATVNSNNTITYTPDTGFVGIDQFTYSVSDGQGGVAVATVKVIVDHGIESDLRSVLLTAIGQSQTVNLQINDLAVPAAVTWAVSDPSVVSITPNNNSVEIRANVSVGSAIVTAEYKSFTIQIPVVIATLEAETMIVDVDDINSVDVDFANGSVISIIATLKRNAATEQITSGRIIINSASTEKVQALSMRVNSVSQNGEVITLQGTQATLDEAYRYLNVNLAFQPTTTSGQNFLASRAVGPLPAINCTKDASLGSAEFSLLSIERSLMPITPVTNVVLGDNGLEFFYLGADIDLDIKAQGPSFEINAQAGFEFECELPLNSIFDGISPIKGLGGWLAFPIGTTPLLLYVSPSIGVEGSIAMQVATASVGLEFINFQYGGRFGIQYDGNDWSRISEVTQEPALETGTLILDPDIGANFQLELFPRFKTDLGIGVAPIPPSVLNVNVLAARLGQSNTLSIPVKAVPALFDPKPPASEYENPEWQSSIVGSVSLDAGLAGGLADLMQDYIDNIDKVISGIDFQLFELSLVVGETANSVLHSPGNVIKPNTPTQLNLSVRPMGTGTLNYLVYAGRPAQVWASRDGGEAFLIGEGLVNEVGDVAFNWTPVEEGTYEISAQIFDRVTGVIAVPYLTTSILVTVAENTDVLIDAFDATPANGAAPLPVSFSWTLNNPSGGYANCNLNLGDGSPVINISDCANNNTFAHTYTEPGRYTATLVTNGATKSVEIMVAKWAFETGQAIFGSPVLSMDQSTAYIGSDDHYLYALDVTNGGMRWRYNTGRAIQSAPAVGNDGTIYLPGDNYSLIALNPNGTLKWQFFGAHFMRSPAIASDGTVYTVDLDCNLYSLDPQTGNENWRQLLDSRDRCFGYSPVIGKDDTIYVRFGWAGINRAGHLVAVNPDKTIKWNITASAGEFRMPGFAADGTIVLTTGYLIGIDPANGNIKWTLNEPIYFPGLSEEGMSPAIGSNGTIYIVDSSGHLNAISPDGSSVLWRVMLEQAGTFYSSPVIGDDGSVYVGMASGEFYAVAPGGTLSWTFTTGSGVYSSPAIGSDGTVFVGSVDHFFYALPSESKGIDSGPWPKFRGNNQNTARAK